MNIPFRQIILTVILAVSSVAIGIMISASQNVQELVCKVENSETKMANVAESIDSDRQKGVHVFGRLDTNSMEPIVRSNFNWVTFVPYAGMNAYDSPSLRIHRGDSERKRRRDSMWCNNIKMVHDSGMKVFLKPHIWIRQSENGKWRSDIDPEGDENWKTWRESYREFILYYAELAERANADMFCIGTELAALSTKRPDFWLELIAEVRSIYSGELTYAANWYKEYDRITFWDKLDYIGIQAYFPLSKKEYASVSEISKGWQKHLDEIESVHNKYGKKVLFTEMGYKSTNDSAVKPWEWMDYSEQQKEKLSTETQANCYEAFFNSVWPKEWFAGVHIWQWRSSYYKSGGEENLDFTPQRKPAESVIAKGFENKLNE